MRYGLTRYDERAALASSAELLEVRLDVSAELAWLKRVTRAMRWPSLSRGARMWESRRAIYGSSGLKAETLIARTSHAPRRRNALCRFGHPIIGEIRSRRCPTCKHEWRRAKRLQKKQIEQETLCAA